MIIQHNVMALNAHRQLGGNNSLVSKNLEKLSSGYRINRAGDDAAGLAVSEKMRAQITGLDRAKANAQDGISLVQTAEGALTEVHSMLNRMVELSTQAANGTLDTVADGDRQKIQDEVDALATEIDRISQSTDFNGIKLLDGKLGNGTMAAPGVSTTKGTVAAAAATAGKFETTGNVGVGAAGVAHTITLKYMDTNGKEQTKSLSYTSSDTAATNAKAIKDAIAADKDLSALFDVTGGSGTDKIAITAKETGAGKAYVTSLETTDATGTTALTGTDVKGTNEGKTITIGGAGLVAGDTITVGSKTYRMAAATNADKSEFADFDGLKAMLEKDGFDLRASANNLNAGTTLTISHGESKGLELQIGDTADAHNKVNVKVDDMGAAALKIGTRNGDGTVTGIKVSDQASASDAIKTIKDAINTVSKNRSKLGALQNRLEHTINNLGVTSENMTAAESRIRDVDMASEMMKFTKNNVITQAAQAMLAQANQQPQQILQLLR